ncbi:MAG: heme exporter protein CcmB [Chloroflexota bacterium]|nr:heme exporter protein CcmB [Chloroflexota bacterium]MDE2969840.1 heme exporter protein CcmB [Chloroflexota bacterium]
MDERRAHPGASWWSAVLAVLWKDLLLESRTREIVTPIVVFSLLVIVIFSFVLDPNPRMVEAVAPGALWVAFTFAGMLGLNRTFALEKERGGMEGLLLSPVGRDALYAGKMLGAFLFMLLVEAIMLPAFSVVFNLPLLEPGLWLTIGLATFGFATVGAAFSAMAVNTRAREILLPVLFFPVAAPVIIAAAEATRAIYAGDAFADYGNWIGLIAAFDVIFAVVAAATFEFIVSE